MSVSLALFDDRCQNEISGIACVFVLTEVIVCERFSMDWRGIARRAWWCTNHPWLTSEVK